MARVKMLVGISGTRNGQDWPPRGGEISLPDGEAGDLVAAGYAELVSTTVVESAAVDTKPARRKAAPAEKRG